MPTRPLCALLALVAAGLFCESASAQKRLRYYPQIRNIGPIKAIPNYNKWTVRIGPDLVITKVHYDGGRTDRVWVTVKNQGNRVAFGSYLEVLVVGKKKRVAVRSLIPGKSTTFIVYTPKPIYGARALWTIDSTNAVKELNERNNRYFTDFGVVY